MPLRLIPPRPGRTPYWHVRGKHLGVTVERSTKAVEKRTARAAVRLWERAIERGEYAPRPVIEAAPATFLAAAIAYMQAGGERKHLKPILNRLGETPLAVIDQMMLDRIAVELYPTASPPTRNRQFYTPVAAVLHHAGVERKVKRPKGWRGNRSTAWLEQEQAFALLAAADAIDAEFGLLCRLLCYTGMRLGECLAIRLCYVNLSEAVVYLPETKNGEARAVHLPAHLVAALANHPPRPVRGAGVAKPRQGLRGRCRADAGVAFLERHPESRLFRFHAGGRLRDMLARAMKAAKLSFPRRQGGFHIFCHTYGTWMHRYAGLDAYGLTRTRRWKDPDSADRYRHTGVSEEARRADLLPVAGKGWR